MNRYKFTGNTIYNCDKTGLMTKHKPSNVVAKRGESNFLT